MEPSVVDALQVACLFEAGVLVVNDVDEVAVVTNDAQFARRNFCIVEHEAVDAQFLYFTGERRLAPEKVFVTSCMYACECVFR